MSEEKSKELRRCLQCLSHDLGVQRPDLLKLLSDDLRALQCIWGINLNDVALARRAVITNLDNYLRHGIIPRSTQRRPFMDKDSRNRYVHAIVVSFNILDVPELQGRNLQGRREWLQEDAPTALRISKRTSQRYFDDAIDQIVEQLTEATHEPAIDDGNISEIQDSSIGSVYPAIDLNETGVGCKVTVNQAELVGEATERTDHPRLKFKGCVPVSSQIQQAPNFPTGVCKGPHEVHHCRITGKKMSFSRHLFVLAQISYLLYWLQSFRQ